MLSPDTTARTRSSLAFHDIVVLFKLRIVVLLLFAALAGAFLGAQGWPGSGPVAVLMVTGLLAASGASALNEYLEREKDALMGRTKKRPLVQGRIARPAWVLAAGIAMIILPVAVVLPTNPALALFLGLGAIIYVGIYTLWLKPRTSLNIVIGGLAGSCAVLSGGAAAGNWSNPGVLGLATLLFFWTPIHFWALALVYKDDYARAGVPMLPVTSSARTAAVWALVHGIAAAGAGLGAALFTPALGLIYMTLVGAASAVLIWQGVRLVLEPSRRRAWHLFHTSNGFLSAVLLAACLDALFHFAP
jgi:heme o synthase